MRWFDRGMLRLRTLFRRDDVEAELNAEFEFHIEQQLAENLAAGMPPKEARDAALRSTGAITQFQEQCREERGLNLLDTTLQDVRYAIRSLRQSPGFTTVAVLSLALGIGANTAVFSLMDSLLLSSLPVKDPQRLVFISTNREKIGNFEVSRTLLFRNLEQFQKQSTQTEGIGSYQGAERLSVAVAGHAELSRGDFVSGNYFQILGVPARIGRTIVPTDDARSGNAGGEGWPAMISTGYWQRRFAQDPGVVGQRITVNTVPFVIVGVLPSSFSGLSIDEPADLMMPMIAAKQVSASSAAAGFPKAEESAGEVFAKLKNGVSQSKAAAEMTVVFRNTELAAEKLSGPEQAAVSRRTIEFQPAGRGSSFLRRRFSEPLRVLMAVVGLVLLIACANIAGLLLAKSTARQKEIAIRLSLGSSRRRIVRQLMTESLLLAVLGSALGVAFAVFARELTVALGISSSSNTLTSAMPWDWRLLAFLAVTSVITALLFGSIPALRATKVEPNEVLKGAQPKTKTLRLPFGRVLVASQLALSLALVAGSGLFLATLRNLYAINLGFASENLLMAWLDPGLVGFNQTQTRSIYERLLRDLQSLPSVTSASLVNNPLLTGRAHLTNAKVPGYVPRPGEDPAKEWTLNYNVGPHYFKTVGMPLVAGRDFTEADNHNATPVVVVNETMARHYFQGKDAVGQKLLAAALFKEGKDGKEEAEIVGVARNSHYFDVKDEYQDAVFAPLLQVQSDEFDSRQTILVRTRENPARAIDDVRAVVRRIDPNLPLFDIRTMTSQLDRSLSQPRLMAVFSSFFGFLALTLSAMGLYGVLAYGVTRRTGEIGIRMALGATRSNILTLILRETGLMIALGVSAGIVLAVACSRLAKSLLYGLNPSDVRVLSVASLLLVVVAVCAALIPARRAVRVDPMVALRYE